MARNQKKYDTEYKIQAVKLSKEIGSVKAAAELGIPVNTIYGWQKAVREGRLDIGSGAHTPQTAMSLAEELSVLRRQVNLWEVRNDGEHGEIGESANFRKVHAYDIGSM